MEIRKLNMQQLAGLIHSNETTSWSALPISRLRLLSQSQNPLLREDDIVMIVAIENNDLAGYIGALPDNIYGPAGREHIPWGCCIWVQPNRRRSGLGRQLIHEMVNAWDGKFIVTEFAPESGMLLKSMKIFETFTEKNGMRFFFRSVFFSIASRRKSKFPVFVPLLTLVDFFVNILQYMRMKLFIVSRRKAIARFREINIQNVNPWAHSQSPFDSNPTKWKWMVSQPWLTTSSEWVEDRYHFPTKVNKFQAGAADITNDIGTKIGQVVYTIYDNTLKLIDVSFTGSLQEEAIFLEAIVSFICLNKIDSLLSYSSQFNDMFTRHPILYFFKKRRKREYIISKALAIKLQLAAPIIEEYDGDVFFT